MEDAPRLDRSLAEWGLVDCESHFQKAEGRILRCIRVSDGVAVGFGFPQTQELRLGESLSRRIGSVGR